MKTAIEINQVINDLKCLFKIGEENEFGSMESNGKFLIDKRQYERLVTIQMLQDYFSDKYINGGYLKVDSITLVFTSFEVCSGSPSV